MGVLLASFMVGAGLLPNMEPRPVVKQIRLAPLVECLRDEARLLAQ